MVRLKTQNDLEIALRQNKWLGEILERFEEVTLPDSWLVAGCVAQTIWNLGHGQPAEFGLKDVDLIYFDELDLSFETEASYERRLRDLFQPLPIKLDVKNEASASLVRRPLRLCAQTLFIQRRRDRNFSNHGNRRRGTSDMRKIGVLRTLRT